MKANFFLLGYFWTFLSASLLKKEIDALLLCYKSKMEQLEGTEKYDFAFSNFNKKEFYKMFVDKEKLGIAKKEEKDTDLKPKYLFDRGDRAEPGYYEGMKEAFKLMRTTIGEKITLDMLIQFHDTAVGHVTKMKKGTGSGSFYHAMKNSIDIEAIKELVDSGVVFSAKEIYENISKGRNFVSGDCDDRVLDKIRGKYFSWVLEAPEGIRFQSLFTSDPKEIETKIEPMISHYYEQIEKVKTLKGKIAAIAELLRALEVAHFFHDGNQRTYSFILLNKLLIENNIPPVILEDPSIFDGWRTLKNITNDILYGFVNFLDNDDENQRKFLNEECQQVSFDKHYLEENDYSPFYKTGFGGKFENLVIAEVKQEIRKSIDTKLIEKLDNNYLMPLEKAIILADKDLVNELLVMGAKPYHAEDYFISPFLTTAIKFFNVDIANKLLEFIDLNQVEKGFISSIKVQLEKRLASANPFTPVYWHLKQIKLSNFLGK